MHKINITSTVFYYDSITELSPDEINLVDKARKSARQAYAPYSSFQVGAAVLLENGKVVTGNNQENSAYPAGLCAERVALFYANAQFPDVPVKSIAITAYFKDSFTEEAVPPCGSCRQVMLEAEERFKSPIRVLLAGKEKIMAVNNAKTLLPLTFGKNFLE